MFEPDRRGLLGLLLSFVVAGPAYAATGEIVVRHARGTLTLGRRPDRVVTFDLATLDTLTTLGVPVVGVPKVALPEQLAKRIGPETARVGTLFDPDYEAVAALAPDLIVVALRSAPKFAELAKIAPTIDLSVGTDDPLAEAEANVRTLAAIFGRSAEAEAALAHLDASIASLRARTAKAGRGLVLLTTGGRLSVFGAGSRFGVIHTVFGMAQADDGLRPSIHGQAASFEYVLERNPDWLFVLDRDAAIGAPGASAKALLDNDLIHQTAAGRAGRIVMLDPAAWYLVGDGLAALQTCVDQLDRALAEKA